MKLPAQASRSNQGNAPGRYRNDKNKVKRFTLKGDTLLFHGGGQQFGTVSEPVKLTAMGDRRPEPNKERIEEPFQRFRCMRAPRELRTAS